MYGFWVEMLSQYIPRTGLLIPMYFLQNFDMVSYQQLSIYCRGLHIFLVEVSPCFCIRNTHIYIYILYIIYYVYNYMYIYVCIYIYVYIYIYVCIYIYLCIYIYMCVCFEFSTHQDPPYMCCRISIQTRNRCKLQNVFI